ncbi:hypothetical protein P8605_44525, partial [Streptomyces sp. T-3]|nr:hypothetical protein [Streptomyces sp. T-3]
EVDTFARTWLGLSKLEEWREAVSTALLGDWMDTDAGCLCTAADEAVVDRLKTHTAVVHRQLQPLWERKVNGRRLCLLDEPWPHGRTRYDGLAAPGDPFEAGLPWVPGDPRIAAVLAQLTPQEREIAQEWAHRHGCSWAQAAEQVGVTGPQEQADSVRRKLKRLGTRHTQRQAAA